MNDKIILYPASWLYNAGVIGLLNILGRSGKNVEDYFENNVLNLNELITDTKSILREELSNIFTEPIKSLPKWHWEYINSSFIWLNGGLKNYFADNIRYSNKILLRPDKKEKNNKRIKIKYGKNEYDISSLDEKFKEILEEKKSIKDENVIINKLIDEINNSNQKELYIYRKTVGSLFSKNCYYQNFYPNAYYDNLDKFLETFNEKIFFVENKNQDICDICSLNLFETSSIEGTLLSALFPSFNEFPNSYWCNNKSLTTKVCSFCKFLIIHHHLALTKLADGSQIFINAPSFKLMYELNRLVKSMFEASTLEEQRTKREILAISIIEYAAKIPVMLGYWTSMNIEVVIKTRDNIDFFSLPFEVVKIISNRNIAILLSEIGETKILNLILDQKYSELVELSYKILRVTLKKDDGKSKQDKSALNDFIKLDKNRKNLIEFSNKLLKLYSLIEEKLKGVEV